MTTPPKSALCVGAMSGTSLDGVDAAVYAIDLQREGAARFVQRAHAYEPYDDALRARLLEVCSGAALPVGELGRLDQRVAAAYVRAVRQAIQEAALRSGERIGVIGMHGQTVHHEPEGALRHTTQIGDPNHVAAAFGVPVVADFRRRDMALGGQGAPLAPSFHQMVLRDAARVRMVINCGGIANVTVLAPGAATLGFDTGPANILMDEWIGRHEGQRYDADGVWARGGRVDEALLAAMLAEPYFALPAPKSTGRELFNADWVRRMLDAQQAGRAIAPQDVQRTLLELTARSIADAIRACGHAAGDAVVCGGGARNALLMERLAALLPGWQVAASDAFGIPAQSMEVLAFATFAWCTLNGVASSEPAVTGATRACLLGTAFLP